MHLIRWLTQWGFECRGSRWLDRARRQQMSHLPGSLATNAKHTGATTHIHSRAARWPLMNWHQFGRSSVEIDAFVGSQCRRIRVCKKGKKITRSPQTKSCKKKDKPSGKWIHVAARMYFSFFLFFLKKEISLTSCTETILKIIGMITIQGCITLNANRPIMQSESHSPNLISSSHYSGFSFYALIPPENFCTNT